MFAARPVILLFCRVFDTGLLAAPPPGGPRNAPRVGLQKTWPGDVPVVRPDWELRFEKPSGLGAAAATVAESGLARSQQPVDLRRANRKNAASETFSNPPKFLFSAGKQPGRQRLEPENGSSSGMIEGAKAQSLWVPNFTKIPPRSPRLRVKITSL
jgi:hypothetical protein